MMKMFLQPLINVFWTVLFLVVFGYFAMQFVSHKVDTAIESVKAPIKAVTDTVSDGGSYVANEIKDTWEVETDRTSDLWEDFKFLWDRDVLGKESRYDSRQGKWVLED